MNSLDLVVIIIAVLAIAIETKRGFGKAIFDFAALFFTLRLADTFHKTIANSIHFSADKQANIAWSYAVLFVVAGIILWFIGKLIYDSVLISLDTFDPPLGALVGIGIAIIVAHAFATYIFLSTVDKQGVAKPLRESSIAREAYTFSTYHNVIDTLKRMGD